MMVNLRAENPADMVRIIEHLRTASETLEAQILAALNYIGGELQSRMKSRASGLLDEKSGKLQRSIYFRVSVRKSGSAYVLTAGVAKRAFYAAFQERGIKPRFIEQRSRRGTRYERLLRLRPRPFIGPSIDEMQDEIMKTVAEAYSGVFSNGA